MQNGWLTRGLARVIMAALAVAGYTAWQRYNLEKQYRGMEMAVVYHEVGELAELRDGDTMKLLETFRRQGVTTVLFKEDTPEMLRDRGDFIIGTGTEVQAYRPELFPEGEVKPGFTYFLTGDAGHWQRVAANMRAKGLPTDARAVGEGYYIISTPLSVARLEEWGLGFPLELMEEVAGAGFNILVQPRTWPQVDRHEIEDVFEPLHRVPNLTGILFNDDKLPGFGYQESWKTLFGVLGHEIEKLGVPLVQIEFTPQMGFGNLARLVDKQVVRLHTISEKEIGKYTPREALDRYVLAATDRNMRILLVRFFTGVEYPDLLDVNRDLLGSLRASLEEEGFTLGRASLFGSFHVSRWRLFIIGLGVVAGGALLALRLFPRRWAAGLGLAGLLGWSTLMLLCYLNPELVTLARKLGALAAVIIFPTLAVMWGVREESMPPGKALLRFVQISLFSLVGAALMVGLLADVGFMLKLDQFAGVKVAHIIPLALLAGYFFFTLPRGEHWLQRLVRTAGSPVTLGLAAAGGVLVLILLIYVLRTGNTGVGAVLPLEQQFRTFLENVLVVRPRTKEFLLGHPLLLLLLFTGYRDVCFIPLLVLGAIGQVSMVNTFAHIHTPLVISLLRGFNGLWLGILGGLVLIGLWQAGRYVWKRMPDIS